MDLKDCKPGVEVILKGRIIRNDEGSYYPLKVEWEMNPLMEIAPPSPYDPQRRYRKGDIVKARLHGRGHPWATDGELFTVAEDETPENNRIVMDQRCPARNGERIYLSYAEIELVESVEERRVYNVPIWEAVRMMLEERKVMERPFVGPDGKPDFIKACVQVAYMRKTGFKWGFKDQAKQGWISCVLSNTDMEAMWREANGEEEQNND